MPTTATSSGTTASFLPVRHAVRVAPDSMLVRINRRRRRSGAPPLRPARDVIPEILALDVRQVSSEQALAWASHPDERVPIVALERDALDYHAMRVLVRRALGDATRESVCWTPLLDALPSDWRGRWCDTPEFRRLDGLKVQFRQAIASRGRTRAELRGALREMLLFSHWTVAEWVALLAPRLPAAEVRALARRALAHRGLGMRTMICSRRPVERAIVATWAVARLGGPGSPHVPIAPDEFEELARLLDEYGALGGLLQLRVAVQLERACRQLFTRDRRVDPRHQESLLQLVRASVRHASPNDLAGLSAAQRGTLLQSPCAEVRLLAMAATRRARRARSTSSTERTTRAAAA